MKRNRKKKAEKPATLSNSSPVCYVDSPEIMVAYREEPLKPAAESKNSGKNSDNA